MRKPFYKILYVQVLFAIAVGILLGHFWPDTGVEMKPLGDAFIKLIKMIIGPIIFCTVVSGIAGMRDMKKVGRVGGKALLYFEIVSTFALLIGLLASARSSRAWASTSIRPRWTPSRSRNTCPRPTARARPSSSCTSSRTRSSARSPMATSCRSCWSRCSSARRWPCWATAPRSCMTCVDQVSKVFFHIVHVITKVAPIGAFGAMAFTIGKYGLGSLVPLLKLIGTFYFTAIVFVLVVLGTVAEVTGFSIIRFVAYIKEELLIVLGTSSSEAALPHLMEKMERLGCSKSVVGLVVPTGYSFNLDGTNIYMTMAVIFIAQATGIELTLLQQLDDPGRGHGDLQGRQRRHRRGLHHAGGHAGRGADHPGGRHGADPWHRPLHERVPRADQHHRQRRGHRGGLGLGKGTGPCPPEPRAAWRR